VLLFIERFLLAILAAVFVGLVVLNPLKFDWTQRVTLGGCIVLGAYFVAHTALRTKEPPKVVEAPDSSDVAMRVRISALIGEAVKLQEQCQGVPNPYKTPWQAQPILAQAIFGWKSRVQEVLSMDLDPDSLLKWQSAILYTSPEDAKNPSIAAYCTELGVKLETLREIAKKKAK
jgi:hypothetical protein